MWRIVKISRHHKKIGIPKRLIIPVVFEAAATARFWSRISPTDGRAIILSTPYWEAQTLCLLASGDHKALVGCLLGADKTHRTAARARFWSRVSPTDGRAITLFAPPLGGPNRKICNKCNPGSNIKTRQILMTKMMRKWKPRTPLKHQFRRRGCSFAVLQHMKKVARITPTWTPKWLQNPPKLVPEASQKRC